MLLTNGENENANPAESNAQLRLLLRSVFPFVWWNGATPSLQHIWLRGGPLALEWQSIASIKDMVEEDICLVVWNAILCRANNLLNPPPS